MRSLGERIKFLREKLGLNQADFARKIGLKSAVAISQYESDQREPDINKLLTISSLCNVNLDWLLTGEGPQYREERKEVMGEKIKGDSELEEIIEYLKEFPQDKKLVLKLLKGKKDIKEALEGFGIKRLVEETLK